MRKAADGEAMVGQHLQVVHLLEMAVANIASGLMPLPNNTRVFVGGVALSGITKRRIPTPGISPGDTNTSL